jgi:ADP-ribosylglycohydrolase
VIRAIIGDIVGSVYEGSVYEWHNIKTKEFPLFREDCVFTDDTVMTVATADALMNGGTAGDFIDSYKKWGRRYPDAGYGGQFHRWLRSGERAPYNSWGNGSAMRVSPCAEYACHAYGPGDRPESIIGNARAFARISAGVTHNHPEGIKGAEATACAMAICYGCPPDSAKEHIRAEIPALFGYGLSKTLDEIRPGYHFDVSCQGTVPQAITAFLESAGFEDAIRNAVSLGGDSDTLAAITGGIAEAAYGVPKWMRDKALSYLDGPLLEVISRFLSG